MKKIISIVIISAFLLLSACSSGKSPDFCVSTKGSGAVYCDEIEFGIDIDFSPDNPVITIRNKENTFDTVYTFYEQKVTMRYDDITSELYYSQIPDKNIALLTYRIVKALNTKGSAQWSKNGDMWYFSGKINEASYKGICEHNGKILSFEIPEYKIYFKKNV